MIRIVAGRTALYERAAHIRKWRNASYETIFRLRQGHRFVAAYIEVMLWDLADQDDRNKAILDNAQWWTNFAKTGESLDSFRFLVAEALQFRTFALNHSDSEGDNDDAKLGRYLWYTRQHHGMGFWDGDYPDLVYDQEVKRAYPELYPYVGDDEFVYVNVDWRRLEYGPILRRKY